MYSSLHNHDGVSNASLGFPDTTNKLDDLIKRAKELGLNSIGITNHEILASNYQAQQLSKKYGIKVVLGNEIYLQDDETYLRDKEKYISGETYYPHFILLALDIVGHEQLQELSSIAWRDNSYYATGMLRKPTKKSDIEKIIGENSGHIFASSACLGSEFSHLVLGLIKAEKDNESESNIYNIKVQIADFLDWCIKVFGKDYFSVEIQPNIENTEQWEYNIRAIQIAKAYDLLCIVTTDSHYLSKEHKYVHTAFLNSKPEKEREVESFYRTAYLMDEQELRNYLLPNIGEENTNLVLQNTNIVSEKVTEYDLSATPEIPKLPTGDFVLQHSLSDYYEKYEYVKKFAYSEEEQNRYLIYRIEQKIREIYDLDHKNLPTIIYDTNGEEIIVRQDYTFEDMISRINSELKELDGLSEIFHQPMSAYYLTFSKVIETIWGEAESLVGAGRGSSGGFLLCYILEITQTNPLWYGDLTPYWRHCSVARSSNSIMDIDCDFLPSKKEQIMDSMRKLFGENNVLQVCTFGTLSSKSAIQTAGRGLGLTIEEVNAISDLIKIERGFVYSINDCLYGNEEKDREPIREFVNKAKEYPDLIEVAMGIEGLIMNRSEHASGVILSNTEYTKHNCCMRSQKGTLTTQFNLSDTENMGAIKYDFLLLTGLEKIKKCMDFLLEDKYIEWQNSLKDTYDKYLHPRNLDYNNKGLWENIDKMPSVFQFDGSIGAEALKVTKPVSVLDLSTANSLMRLMGEINGETNLQRFSRYKDNIQSWYKDMTDYGLTQDEQNLLKKYLLASRGTSDTQEKIMLLVMDENICNGDLKFADRCRKVVAKKKANDIATLKQEIFDKAQACGTSNNLINYVWDFCFAPQMMYSFSSIHSLSYSTIAVQEGLMYNLYPSILWNAACLIIDSGTDENIENKTQDYGKIANALCQLLKFGTKISLPNINMAKFGFYPFIEENEIAFGLKGITSINDNLANLIIENRPYSSFQDFVDRLVTPITEEDKLADNILQAQFEADYENGLISENEKIKFEEESIADSTANKKLTKIQVINLIKAGCFDELEKKPRTQLMQEYLWKTTIAEKGYKNKITQANIINVSDLDMLKDTEKIYVRYYNFNKYITNKEFVVDKINNKVWILAKDIAFTFFEQHYINELIEDKDYKYTKDGIVFCKPSYDKVFKARMKELLEKLNTPDMIQKYNELIYKKGTEAIWNKYCTGTVADWEMDALSFYYGKHALADIDMIKYNISNYQDIPEDPVVEGEHEWGGRMWSEYQIYRICGTVLDNDRTKHTITLLTHDNEVVNIKFYAGAYINYNKVIKDTEKGITEKSWFSRGNKLLLVGFRRGDTFMPKTYKKSIYRHTVALIDSIDTDGNITTKELRLNQKENNWGK